MTHNPARQKINQIIHPIVSPIRTFLQLEFATGLVMIFAMLVALIWANSFWAHYYHEFVHYPIGFQIGDFAIQETLHFWVNDALMAIFFFVVGMEIKRELLVGELSSLKKAALPMIAALGGMVIPALIYYWFNPEGAASSGWGIPMATDIAFAVGVLTLLSKRVPFALKVFLLALAIADDLGAIFVIAVFYTSELSYLALTAAGAIIGLVIFFNKIDIRNIYLYIFLGILAWISLHYSGVHATVTGVLLGFINPLEPKVSPKNLGPSLIELSNKLESAMQKEMQESDDLFNEDTKRYLDEIRFVAREAQSPLERMIETLHPWVSFFIIPLFALVNAGVTIGEVSFQEIIHHPIALGVGLGLVVGKPVGIFLFSFIAVKLGISELPSKVTWLQVLGVSCIAGIGFTVALFVSGLALGGAPDLEIFSKMGILIASVIATILGFLVFAFCPPVKQ